MKSGEEWDNVFSYLSLSIYSVVCPRNGKGDDEGEADHAGRVGWGWCESRVELLGSSVAR